MRLLIPSVLVVAAIGLFVAWTNPTYQKAKALSAQVGAFDEALNRAQELKSRRDELLSRRNTFSSDNVQKLDRILPDNVDNIRFTIDIQNIAARHNLALKNVALGTVSDSKASRSALSVGSSGDPVGSAEISFAVIASYDDFLAFLQDLEHSLRIVDVEKISFKSGDNSVTGKYEFGLTIRTYWLH